MAHKEVLIALGMIAAASPVSASQIEEVPAWLRRRVLTPDIAFESKPSPAAGSREFVAGPAQEWAENDVDVDREWAKEGVRVIG